MENETGHNTDPPAVRGVRNTGPDPPGTAPDSPEIFRAVGFPGDVRRTDQFCIRDAFLWTEEIRR